MYKYVVVGNGSYEEYEGCWIFSTFKNAFDFVASMYNKEYDIWKSNGCEIYSNINSKLCDEHYKHFLMKEDTDDGSLYIEPLYYTIHDKCNEHGSWSNGAAWEIYTAKETN